MASLLGGLATNDIWLIITRGVQGIGAAIAAPTALVTHRNELSRGQRAQPGHGRLRGDVRWGRRDWTAPRRDPHELCLVALDLLYQRAHRRHRALSRPRERSKSQQATLGPSGRAGRRQCDRGMLLLVYGLSNASSHSWSSISTIIPLVASVVLLLAFGFIERRSDGSTYAVQHL